MRPSAKDAACEHEAGFVLGRKVGETGQLLVLEKAVRQVELRLDISLTAAGPDRAGITLRTEQEADRLREDRLAGTGLAGDRGQAGRRRELSLTHEHEVLDPEATKQRFGGSG